jgi:hypothetical protein
MLLPNSVTFQKLPTKISDKPARRQVIFPLKRESFRSMQNVSEPAPEYRFEHRWPHALSQAL